MQMVLHCVNRKENAKFLGTILFQKYQIIQELFHYFTSMIAACLFPKGKPTLTVVDPGFPRQDANRRGGAPTYFLAIFAKKLHEIEEKIAP